MDGLPVVGAASGPDAYRDDLYLDLLTQFAADATPTDRDLLIHPNNKPL